MTSANCTCLAGVTNDCKHSYALIYFVNNHRIESKTSFQQEWGKPSESQSSKEKYAQPMRWSDQFKLKRKLSPIRAKPFDLKLRHVAYSNNPLKKWLQSWDSLKLFFFL